MGGDVMAAVVAVIDHLLDLSERDDRLRAKLHDLALAVVAATAPTPPRSVAESTVEAPTLPAIGVASRSPLGSVPPPSRPLRPSRPRRQFGKRPPGRSSRSGS